MKGLVALYIVLRLTEDPKLKNIYQDCPFQDGAAKISGWRDALVSSKKKYSNRFKVQHLNKKAQPIGEPMPNTELFHYMTELANKRFQSDL